MSSGNILMQHSTTSKSGQLMYQNAPTKWLLNRHFYIKTRKSCQTCKWKVKKLVKHFTLKPQIFSNKPETSQQEEKKRKRRKVNRRKNSHIPGFKLLIVKRMPKKKNPNHAVSKNPVSNYCQHICGNHGL